MEDWAREYILNKRKGLIDKGDQDGLSKQIRALSSKICRVFQDLTKSSGFNMNKLGTYIDELTFSRQDIAVGNFQWKDNIRDGKVIFVANSDGKFRVSHQLDPDQTNKKIWDDDAEGWRPANTHWG